MSVVIYNSFTTIPDQTTLCIPCFEGYSRPDLQNGLESYGIQGAVLLDLFDGKKGQSEWLFVDSTKNRTLLLGLGKSSQDSVKLQVLSSVAKNKKKFSEHIVFDIRHLQKDEVDSIVENLFKGVILGLKYPGLYKTKKDDNELAYSYGLLIDDSFNDTILQANANKGMSKAATINQVIDLVNAPSNRKTTDDIAQWMVRSAKNQNYKLQIIELDELKEAGFHALVAVNQGSPVPAKCLVADYCPVNLKDLKTVLLVGKGVTFDTGGVSMKGPQNMHYMKSDMGGAAAVMGTIEVVAKLNLPLRVIAVIPTTDNSVDALSIKPGDVISSYAGKSIEIIDTDAEGRLILADGLSYGIKNFEADYVIDLATLTGSVIRTLGNHAAGIMSHNDELVSDLIIAGERTHEKLWRLPLWQVYGEMMESDIADIKNLSAKPVAGSITAGKFLEFFVEEHPGWAHLDIAGTSFGTYPTTKEYSATGFGVDLLVDWLENLSNNQSR